MQEKFFANWKCLNTDLNKKTTKILTIKNLWANKILLNITIIFFCQCKVINLYFYQIYIFSVQINKIRNKPTLLQASLTFYNFYDHPIYVITSLTTSHDYYSAIRYPRTIAAILIVHIMEVHNQ